MEWSVMRYLAPGFPTLAICDSIPIGDAAEVRPSIAAWHVVLEPGDHPVQDHLVVLLQHQRVAVAADAGFGQHINRHVAAERRHLLLEDARGFDSVGRAIADDDQDRHLDELLQSFCGNLVEGARARLDRKDALEDRKSTR